MQDGAEHAHGYMSNEAIKTLKMIDSLLGQMLAKLDRYTFFFHIAVCI